VRRLIHLSLSLSAWLILPSALVWPQPPQPLDPAEVGEGSGLSAQGAIEFDRRFIGCEGSLTVTLRDADLRGTGAVEVSVEATSGDGDLDGDLDGILLTLEETAPDSGIFTGDLRTVISDSPASDEIRVQNADVITATYRDPDTGAGSPAVVSATVTVDCMPPGIRVRDERPDRFTVALNTDEPTTSVVCAGLTFSAATSSVSLGASGRRGAPAPPSSSARQTPLGEARGEQESLHSDRDS
jgi:hypothetical protein